MVGRVFVAMVVLMAMVTVPRMSGAQCGAMCLYEVGSADNALSAAGASARADDAATALFNIAGTTRLEGVQVLTATVLGFVDQEFNVSGKTQPANAGNSGGQLGDFLPLGSAFVSWQFWDEARFAFSFAGLYGGALEYDNGWAGRTSITEATFVGLNLAPGFAYPFELPVGRLSIGAAVNVLFLKMDYQRKAFSGELSPTLEVDDAEDWTVAGTVSLLYELPSNKTRLGFNYRSPANVNLSGDIDSSVNARFDSKFDLAQGLNVGVFHELTDKVALLGDLGWTDWSTFDYQGIALDGVDDDPIPRNFKDTWRLGIGTQVRPWDTWTLSGGFSYDSSPVDAEDRRPDMPASEQYRFSVGVLRQPADNIRLGIGYTFLWAANNDIDKVSLGDGVVLDGHYDPSFIHFITVNVAVQFQLAS